MRSRSMFCALLFHFWRSCCAITFFWYKAASTTKWRGGHIRHEDRWWPTLHELYTCSAGMSAPRITHPQHNVNSTTPILSVNILYNRTTEYNNMQRMEWGQDYPRPQMSLIVQKEQKQQKTYYTFVNARACRNSGTINAVNHFIVKWGLWPSCVWSPVAQTERWVLH